MQTKKCINSYTVQLFKMFTYVTCIYFYVGIGENRKKSVFTEAEVQRDHLVRFRFWGLKFSNFYFVLPVKSLYISCTPSGPDERSRDRSRDDGWGW